MFSPAPGRALRLYQPMSCFGTIGAWSLSSPTEASRPSSPISAITSRTGWLGGDAAAGAAAGAGGTVDGCAAGCDAAVPAVGCGADAAGALVAAGRMSRAVGSIVAWGAAVAGGAAVG